VACAETPSHSRGPGNIRGRVSFATGTVRSAILATAGLLVNTYCYSLNKLCMLSGNDMKELFPLSWWTNYVRGHLSIEGNSHS